MIPLQRWLADDFQKERQRHIGNAKKITKAVDTYHKTKDARKLKKSRVSLMAKHSTFHVLMMTFSLGLRAGRSDCFEKDFQQAVP